MTDEWKVKPGCTASPWAFVGYSHRLGEHPWHLLAALVLPAAHAALVKLLVGLQLAITASLDTLSLNTDGWGVRRTGRPVHDLERYNRCQSSDWTPLQRLDGASVPMKPKSFCCKMVSLRPCWNNLLHVSEQQRDFRLFCTGEGRGFTALGRVHVCRDWTLVFTSPFMLTVYCVKVLVCADAAKSPFDPN